MRPRVVGVDGVPLLKLTEAPLGQGDDAPDPISWIVTIIHETTKYAGV
jgi:hypothetical protein